MSARDKKKEFALFLHLMCGAVGWGAASLSKHTGVNRSTIRNYMDGRCLPRNLAEFEWKVRTAIKREIKRRRALEKIKVMENQRFADQTGTKVYLAASGLNNYSEEANR